MELNLPSRETAIKVGGSTAGNVGRHLSGKRRSGFPCPECPCCSTPLYCIFSLDTSDELLALSPIWESGDADFLVCPACSMYIAGYFVRFRGADATVLYGGPQEAASVAMVQPYPQAGLSLEPIPPDSDSSSPAVLDAMEGRQLGSGVYHRISPNVLWGTIDRPEQCPSCEGSLQQVAIIDSDESLGLQRRYRDGKLGRVSLNWVDDFYLAVSFCRGCRIYGYHPAHG